MFNKRSLHRQPKGQGLVEALVGIGILAIALISIALLLADSFRLATRGGDLSSATALAGEGVNAVQSIARRNWTEIVAGTYGLASPSNYWVLSGTSNVIGLFTRQLIVENVNRDVGGDIVLVGGSNDTETKKVTSRVTWLLPNGSTSTLDSIVYVTRWFTGVQTWIQTLLAEFNLGKRHGTITANAAGGEVTLDSYGPYSVVLTSAYIDLTGTVDAASVFIDDRNHLFVGRLADGAGPEFFLYDAADGSNHTYTLLDTEEIGANVNAIAVSGDYAYLGTSSGTAELRVYKLSTHALVNTLNMTGTAAVNALAISGTDLYVGRANSASSAEFSKVSIVSPESALTASANTEIGFDVNTVAISGSYAFLGTGDTGNELKVVRLSDLVAVNSYNASGNNTYYRVRIIGTSLYAASSNSNAEMEKINIATPTGTISSLGTYNVSGNTVCRGEDTFGTRVALGCDDGKMYIINGTDLSTEGSALLSPAGSPRAIMFGDGFLYTASTGDSGEVEMLNGASSDIVGWVAPSKVGELAMNNAVVYGVDLIGTNLFVGTSQRPDPEFNVIDVTNAAAPAVIGSSDPNYVLTSVVASGNYVYTGTSDGGNEVKIYDVSTPTAPILVAQYDLGGSQNVASLALVGTKLYVGRKAGGGAVRELTVLDVTTPTAPSFLGELELGASTNGIYVKGNYAYLASDANAQEMKVVNISNPALMSMVASVNLSGNTDALSVAGKDNWVFLGRDNNSGDELYVYDITTPTAPNQVASLEIGGAMAAMSVNGNLLAAVSSDIWVLDIANLPTPNILSTTPMGDQAQAVKFSGDCLYIGSSNSTKALQIYCRNPSPPPGNAVASEGNFRSQSFDATAAVLWNTIYWTATVPGGTSLSFQIRTADSLANLPTATFVGPDGTPNTFYTTSGTSIVTAPSATGTRFVEWQAYMTTSNTSAPTIQDVSLEYQ